MSTKGIPQFMLTQSLPNFCMGKILNFATEPTKTLGGPVLSLYEREPIIDIPNQVPRNAIFESLRK